MSDHQRDDAVADGPEPVHPIGSPISHSTQSGFRLPPTAFGSCSPAVGVGHNPFRAIVSRLGRSCPGFAPPAFRP